MELDWLEDFAALAEVENFSRAAARRNITQPAFSRRIRAFEEWLGAELFVRGRQKVALTRAGEEIRAEAEAVARAVRRMRRVARDSLGREAATLHFAATHSLSFSFFPGWIKQYAQLLDRSAINLISDTMAACEDALVRGQVRFLLCHDAPGSPSRFRDKGFACRAVGKDTLSPYAAPGKNGKPLWDLADFPAVPARWLQYSPESGFSRMMLGHAGIAACMAASAPGFTSRLATVLLSVARDGQGVAWLPASLAAASVEQGLLVRAGGSDWDIIMEIRLFQGRDEHNEAAAALWRAVEEEAKCHAARPVGGSALSS